MALWPKAVNCVRDVSVRYGPEHKDHNVRRFLERGQMRSYVGNVILDGAGCIDTYDWTRQCAKPLFVIRTGPRLCSAVVVTGCCRIEVEGVGVVPPGRSDGTRPELTFLTQAKSF